MRSVAAHFLHLLGLASLLHLTVHLLQGHLASRILNMALRQDHPLPSQDPNMELQVNQIRSTALLLLPREANQAPNMEPQLVLANLQQATPASSFISNSPNEQCSTSQSYEFFYFCMITCTVRLRTDSTYQKLKTLLKIQLLLQHTPHNSCFWIQQSQQEAISSGTADDGIMRS